ncbi:MAG: hypothetical protein ABI699_00505 [Caldimonas sp.]
MTRAVVRGLLLLAAFAATLVQAQGGLPKGMLQAKPQSWETETTQAGGHGSASYQFVGTLRCKSLGDAIVGVRTLRSEVVDLIQVGCARIECTDDLSCSWQQLDRGAYAGMPNDKSQPAIAVCPHDSVVSGYRARLRLAGGGPVDYVGELQFECARVIAAAIGAGDGKPDGGLPVSDSQRSWLPLPPAEGGAPATPGDAPWQVEARCAQRAATGVSVAIGTYKPTGHPVIQALSLFCTRAPQAAGAINVE